MSREHWPHGHRDSKRKEKRGLEGTKKDEDFTAHQEGTHNAKKTGRCSVSPETHHKPGEDLHTILAKKGKTSRTKEIPVSASPPARWK